jgi:hypothetical protein
MIAGVNVATSLQGFFSENILHATKPHQIKIRMPRNWLTPQDRAQYRNKEKARTCGLF